jgi:integrase
MSEQIGYVGQRKSDGKWFARIHTGNFDRTKWAKSETEALELLDKLRSEYRSQAITASPAVTISTGNGQGAPLFREIAAQYSEHKIKPAKYRNDRKVSGLRDDYNVRRRLATLVNYFGDTRIDRITVATVERFKQERLDTPVQSPRKRGTERSLADVNRELEILRSVLRFARNEGHISVSPFERSSSPLISKADETKRTRVMTADEEKRLLAACDRPERAHLIPLIIFAVDTGMRKGEMLSLTSADIDVARRTITVRAMTTKTLQPRIVPISRRLLAYLRPLMTRAQRRGGASPIFPHKDWCKGWYAAMSDAKITGLRWHDLRATFITRMVDRGVPVELVAKISGHQDVRTLYAHYLRQSGNALDAVRSALDAR